MANPPTNVVATAQTSTNVQVSWIAAPGATHYQILPSADAVNYTLLTVNGVVGTTYIDPTAQASTAYLYVVRASAPNISDNSVPILRRR